MGVPKGYQFTHRAKRGETLFCSVHNCRRKSYSFGYCGLHYERLKDHGTLESNRRTWQERFWEKVNKIPRGCREWTSAFRRDGYGVLSIKNKAQPVHRLSWLIHNGPIASGLWVLHKCDNKKCVKPAHLFLGDSQANIDDMITKGRNARGEAMIGAKLTEKDVVRIRELRISSAAIARHFGVCRQLIDSIKNGSKWRHVK